jgi:predicted secreted protein
MKKLKMNAYYLAVLVCLVILVIAGSYFVYKAYHPSETLRQNQQQDLTLQPTPVTPAPAQSTSPAVSVPGSTQDPGSPRCDSPPVVDSQIPVLANISIAIRDPVPGIRYSLGENDSGKTIMLGTGDIVEINLRWIPGLGFHWVVPVSGCGLELVNAGTYSDGGDIWNNTGHYVVRYRAVSPGTSSIDGKFILVHEEKGDLGFNLTVIVK